MAVNTTWGGFGAPLPDLGEISAEDMAAHEASTSLAVPQNVKDTFVNTSSDKTINAPYQTTSFPGANVPAQVAPNTAGGFFDDRPDVYDASRYLTPETDMGYQISKQMEQDSPGMKQAMTQARRGQAGSGMLDTDATAVNVRNALYDEARDIAKINVETARGFGSGQQQAESALSSIYAQGDVAAQNLNLQHQNTLTQLQTDYGYKWDFQQDQNAFQQDVLQMGFDQQSAESLGAQLTSMSSIVLGGMQNIMNTPGQTFTQDMLDNGLDFINDWKTYATSLRGFELAA